MTIDEAVKSLNEEARQEMKKCSCLDEMMKVFSDNNIDITVDEIENAFNNRELSDDELAGVTGGVAFLFVCLLVCFCLCFYFFLLLLSLECL